MGMIYRRTIVPEAGIKSMQGQLFKSQSLHSKNEMSILIQFSPSVHLVHI